MAFHHHAGQLERGAVRGQQFHSLIIQLGQQLRSCAGYRDGDLQRLAAAQSTAAQSTATLLLRLHLAGILRSMRISSGWTIRDVHLQPLRQHGASQLRLYKWSKPPLSPPPYTLP